MSRTDDDTVNDTVAYTPVMQRFGAPQTVLRHFQHWCLLARPKQATLGAMVLIAREPASSWPALEADAFTELAQITGIVEAALYRRFACDKINYLMLMMVDPEVHFHILPRYQQAPVFAAQYFPDPGWPGPPCLDQVTATSAAQLADIVSELRRAIDAVDAAQP